MWINTLLCLNIGLQIHCTLLQPKNVWVLRFPRIIFGIHLPCCWIWRHPLHVDVIRIINGQRTAHGISLGILMVTTCCVIPGQGHAWIFVWMFFLCVMWFVDRGCLEAQRRDLAENVNSSVKFSAFLMYVLNQAAATGMLICIMGHSLAQLASKSAYLTQYIVLLPADYIYTQHEMLFSHLLLSKNKITSQWKRLWLYKRRIMITDGKFYYYNYMDIVVFRWTNFNTCFYMQKNVLFYLTKLKHPVFGPNFHYIFFPRHKIRNIEHLILIFNFFPSTKLVSSHIEFRSYMYLMYLSTQQSQQMFDLHIILLKTNYWTRYCMV